MTKHRLFHTFLSYPSQFEQQLEDSMISSKFNSWYGASHWEVTFYHWYECHIMNKSRLGERSKNVSHSACFPRVSLWLWSCPISALPTARLPAQPLDLVSRRGDQLVTDAATSPRHALREAHERKGTLLSFWRADLQTYKKRLVRV